ncbi:MAG TPA: zinc metallopeptidase [Tepiditoga sp.]|nr:zinc metallopeptidase [Thermotogota bacterium]HOO75105.1 zinc metallopeptidase [Tepiditoga sp.]
MLPIWDWTIIILIPVFILSLIAQITVKSTFEKYSRKKSSLGENGASFARRILDSNGLFDVQVEHVRGMLSDHYDPSNKVLRLSDSTYNSYSVAALGVVAHEAGHAVQHEKGYKPLVLRNLAVPMANFGSNLSWLIFIVGLFMSSSVLLNAGIFLFSFVVLFTLITLPVEFDASHRAIKMLPGMGMMTDEVTDVKKVLSAAALTYVASAFTAIAQLLRMLLIAGRRD